MSDMTAAEKLELGYDERKRAAHVRRKGKAAGKKAETKGGGRGA